MGKHYPKEFHNYVVRVARLGTTPLARIAEDFGVCRSSRSTTG